MRVGIVTFQHANNYGALLQTYALQTFIKKYGVDCDVIAYQSDYIEKPYRFEQLKRKGVKQYIVGTLGYICYLPRRKACNEFRKQITYSHAVDKNTIKNINSDYDLFIAGSDQVWNYKLTGGDPSFLLDFVEQHQKKNSYAASIGLDDIEPAWREEYKKLLSSFNHIAVREKRAKEILHELGGIESSVVVDPTLLLTAEEWDKLIEKEEIKEDYILVYQLGISKRLVSYVKELSRRKGMKVKYIPFPLGGYVNGRFMLKAGPFEWLKLFKNAKYVVTDSFHGLVFSLIFNKQFIAEVTGTNKSVGGRIYGLLSVVGLENRILNHENCEDIDIPIDYNFVQEMIGKEREFSINYLRKVLGVQ